MLKKEDQAGVLIGPVCQDGAPDLLAFGQVGFICKQEKHLSLLDWKINLAPEY